MKEFVKMVCAVICALLLVQILGFLLFFLSIGSIALSGGNKPVLPREGVLDLNMADFTLGEQAQEADFSVAALSSGFQPVLGLWDAVQALEKAAADPAIKYVFLRPDAASGGVATMEEFRDALVRFRESGKPVVAYLENPGNGSYYLATAADKIYLSSLHGGNASLVGLSTQMLFVKDLLDKVGVNCQLIRHGKYKSAGEMYVKNAPSAENYEQNKVMVDGLWKSLLVPMAEARGLAPEALNQLIDNLSLNFPEDFLEAGLVDELVDREALIAKLCTLAEVEKQEDVHLVRLQDYINAKVTGLPAGKTRVGILFADGSIVEGDDLQEIAGDRFVREIEKIRKDATVKSVVLRVNSPGGSVLASEKIRSALAALMEEKPVVASYGNYAASGGYWISAGCQKVYSDATSITGSIGVFSMIPDLSKLPGKVGVNIVTIGSNKHSDMLGLMRPLDAEEQAYMQASVEDIYDSFVNIVARARNMEPAAVDAIAQGRVWTGSDALGIGLVDEIGTLKEAVAYAASLAGLLSEDDFSVAAFPAPLTPFQQVMLAFGQNNEEPQILEGTPFQGLYKALVELRGKQPGVVFAQLPYALEIR